MNNFIPYTSPFHLSEGEMVQATQAYYLSLQQRRSVRDFSSKPVPQSVIRNLIMTASTAPSGANKQPWSYCAVSDLSIKTAIRKAAEQEEFENYHHRMSEEWLRDLAPLGTYENKEFLETAPWLIIIFKKAYDIQDNKKRKNYYVSESVGISCGVLLTAIFQAGLVALTHTPSPMNFLKKILNRPENETPYLLIPVGFPADNACVPDILRKAEEEVITWYT